MRLRFKSFISVLESNNYTRKSLKGLANDLPDMYELLKQACEKEEAYGMLDLLVHKKEELDLKYLIYCRPKELPHYI